MYEPQARAVTDEPGHHFFGYYDKCCLDGSGRYVLCLQAGFADRQPGPADTAAVGFVDLEDGGPFTPLGHTRAWNWQQGSMLHWLPVPHATGHVAERDRSPDTPHIIHNDRLDPGEEPRNPSSAGWGGFREGEPSLISVVREFPGGEVVKTLPMPVYALSRDGTQAVTLNFPRLHRERPGYGYAGVPDPWERMDEPDDDGIYRMDTRTGEHRLIFSLKQAARMDRQKNFSGAVHRFNHLQFSPEDGRFIFLHRWREKSQSGHRTRLLTARPDGSGTNVVASHGYVSHFDWRDEGHILAWARHEDVGDGYFLYEDRPANCVARTVGEGVLTRDGHCSFSPDGRWLLTDEYPSEQPYRALILWDLRERRRVDVGSFYSPPGLAGATRDATCILGGAATEERSASTPPTKGAAKSTLWTWSGSSRKGSGSSGLAASVDAAPPKTYST